MKRLLIVSSLLCATVVCGAVPGFQSLHYAIGLSPTRPAFSWFGVDSLGRGRLEQNPVLVEPATVAEAPEPELASVTALTESELTVPEVVKALVPRVRAAP